MPDIEKLTNSAKLVLAQALDSELYIPLKRELEQYDITHTLGQKKEMFKYKIEDVLEDLKIELVRSMEEGTPTKNKYEVIFLTIKSEPGEPEPLPRSIVEGMKPGGSTTGSHAAVRMKESWVQRVSAFPVLQDGVSEPFTRGNMKTITIMADEQKSYNCSKDSSISSADSYITFQDNITSCSKDAGKMSEPEEPRYECRVARIDADITTFRILARMSWIATKLYNTALYAAKDTWNKTGKIPTGFDLQKIVLESYWHSFVPAHTYQHPAHQVGNAFRSWFKLRKKDVTARPPGFRKKEELSTFMMDAFKVKGIDTVFITPTDELKEDLSYHDKQLPLNLHWNTPFPEGGKIKQIEIVPREKKGFFELHAKILLPEPVWKTEGQVVAIDLGQRNPIVSKDEQGNVEIFKGGKILSDLRYWNKEKARVASQVMARSKGKKKYSKPLGKMAKKGAAQVNHAIHTMTSTFVNLCNQRNVKEVIIGDLKGIKKEKNGTGKNWNDKSNQNWQQFPIRKLVTQLDYKLARSGIKIIEQDERGTSKGRCSACGCMDRSKLHRVHRGLFLCENCGTIQNADVNGAGNQLARYLRKEQETRTSSSSGCLAQPSIWNFDNHLWVVR